MKTNWQNEIGGLSGHGMIRQTKTGLILWVGVCALIILHNK